MNRRMKRSRAGWSLIEMLIVLAVAGILATLSISYMISARPHAQLERAEIALHSVLQHARNKAVSEELLTKVEFSVAESQLWVSWVDPGSGEAMTMPVQTLPEGIIFENSGIPAVDGEILFSPRGSLVSGGSTASGGTITLVNALGETSTLTANVATGRFPLVGGNLR